MRVIFNEGLKAVADDLDHMARDVRDAIRLAGEALLHQDLDAAQRHDPSLPHPHRAG